MKLGTIGKSKFVLSGRSSADWAIHTFVISPQSLSFSEIADSAFSAPARYIQEIFTRLSMLETPGREEAKFVFNPLYETNRFSILLVLRALRKIHSSQKIAVLVDEADLPVGYLLPAWFKREDSRFLMLLSTVSGDTDAKLLHRLFFTEVISVRIDHLHLNKYGHNGFSYEGFDRIYRWVALRAIEILEAKLPSIPYVSNALEAKRQRDAIPFTAIMPYHAGDVLFFTIAFNNIQTHFSRIVVSRVYLNIISNNAPLLTPLPIDVPPNHRNKDSQPGDTTPDPVHFESFQDVLPKDSFYYYCRPTRNYSATKFHLIDHFAFALGHSSYSIDELLINKKPSPDLFQPDIPAYPIKILLHFDGGWPLKIYSRKMQEKLIDRLYACGYLITVLAGAAYEHPKCSVTTFQNYDQFIDLLKGHHILVGMDSFPSHYSAHVLGLPTICLFSSTRPANSNAPRTINYAHLEAGLQCCPCDAAFNCPQNGNDTCKNFVGPEEVANEIDKMIKAVRSGNPEQHSACPPRTMTDNHSSSTPKESQTAVEQINLDRVGITIYLEGTLLPHFHYLLELYREFIRVVKRDGMLSATQKAIQFTLRRVWRKTK